MKENIKNEVRFDYLFVKNIFDTLPIGYYLKRRIDTKLDKDSTGSFYDPIADEITISFKMIKESLQKAQVSTVEEAEVITRGLLFHEISHVILTSTLIFTGATYKEQKDVRNIFEDERIETLLKDYYLLTDFKENVRIINGLSKEELARHLQTPSKDALEEFYKVVRFRKKSKYSNEVSEIIRQNKHLRNHISPEYDGWQKYTKAIDELYEKIKKDFQQQNENQNQQSDCDSNGSTQISGDGAQDITKVLEGLTDGGYESVGGLSAGAVEATLNEFINNSRYHDSKLYNEISKILSLAENHNKEANGSHFSQVSGRFSPKRYFKSDNYDFFIRKKGENNKQRKNGIELNLYIDSSGSFNSNTNTVRKLLYCLSQLEKINKKFSFNVCSFNTRPKVLEKGNRLFTASGGSCMQKEMEPIIKSFQNDSKNNFNIVLMDGSFNNSELFRYFNNKTFTVISDHSNSYTLSSYAPRAKIILCENYCQELIKRVLEVLKYYLTV